MFSWSKSSENIGIFSDVCIKCGKESNFRLTKKETTVYIFIIPIKSNSYTVICGNCFEEFKLDNKKGKQIEHTMSCFGTYNVNQEDCFDCHRRESCKKEGGE